MEQVCGPSSQFIRGEGSSTLRFVGREVECQDLESKTDVAKRRILKSNGQNAADRRMKRLKCYLIFFSFCLTPKV